MIAALASVLLACGDDGKAEAPLIKLKPFSATGQPLDAPTDARWTFFEFPDTTCQDGSPAGISVSRVAGSKKLMIYLEGGGACFDSNSCFISPGNTKSFPVEHSQGLFDRTKPNNPVKDWNYVYVPYCTGDTHGGARRDVMVAGSLHQFTGYSNITAFLQRIVPTFADSTDVLLTGISAGGYGAAQNAVQVGSAFPNVKMKLIDDSGPGFSTKVMPSCLQVLWRDLFGYKDTFLKDCGAACPDHDNFVNDYAVTITRSFSDRSSGMIESLQDGIISKFIAAGNNNCTGRALIDQVPLDIYAADLLSFREQVKPYPNFGTYLPTSTQHTWLGLDLLYTESAGGVNLIDWVTKIVNGEAPGNAGP
ncbi:MAG: hypothetical protein JWN48_5294 [Myxococcaceae bacterium]|nr:hypothetical protein [Myxococcaceae bacterium]